MADIEKQSQPESTEWFTQHEFWKMIETPTAKAILVNKKYDAGKMKESNETILIWLREKMKWRMEEAFDSIDISKEVSGNLLPSLSSFIIECDEGYVGLWSWWFIRPNVILSVAHNLRREESWEVIRPHMISDGVWNKYTVKAIYYTKINSEDIGFIVTHEENTHYVDLYKKDEVPSDEVIVLWTPNLKPRFTVWEEESTLYQKYRSITWMDADNDWKDDGDEYLLSTNGILAGDSWGFAISRLWELKGIATRGMSIFWFNISGAYIEPQSKIVKQYWDFIQAMTKLWVEIK